MEHGGTIIIKSNNKFTMYTPGTTWEQRQKCTHGIKTSTTLCDKDTNPKRKGGEK